MSVDQASGRIRELDKWVIGSLTVICATLIALAGLTSSASALGYLAGPAALAVVYFIVVRD